MKINFHRVLLGFLKTGINHPRKSGIRVVIKTAITAVAKNDIIQAFLAVIL